ncbi:hypothetical protein DB346_24050 [Verrucomicrobia bacterium LW23]|nr:hypothetical protein DB346_24050 [Verrucomicrobia bacterium LW23]
MLLLLLLSFAQQAVAQSKASFFGSEEESEFALVGIIYDLKQTQKREPTRMDAHRGYSAVVEEFLEKGWDEGVLNRYFRCARPLYTTQIFIPTMGAGEAPKAFGLEKVIKPSMWVAHYKGQVSPPEPGTYRFVGYADDLMAVAVNSKTVLFGSRFNTAQWKGTEKNGPKAGNGFLTYGDWITIKKDEVIDLDIVIGERPGGQFNGFLLYQKQGETYQNDEKGFPILPIFQLAPFETQQFEANRTTRFAPSTKYWKGH